MCPFSTKAKNAEKSGYGGLIIVNRIGQSSLEQFGFGDVQVSIPTIALEETKLLNNKINVFQAILDHEITAKIELYLTDYNISQRVLTAVSKNVTKTYEANNPSKIPTVAIDNNILCLHKAIAHYNSSKLQLFDESCRQSNEVCNQKETSVIQVADGDIEFRNRLTYTWYMLGNIFQYRFKPVNSSFAFYCYQMALSIDARHLPSLTNIGDMLYKHDIEGISTHQKELYFVRYKSLAQDLVMKSLSFEILNGLNNMNKNKNNTFVVDTHLKFFEMPLRDNKYLKKEGKKKDRNVYKDEYLYDIFDISLPDIQAKFRPHYRNNADVDISNNNNNNDRGSIDIEKLKRNEFAIRKSKELESYNDSNRNRFLMCRFGQNKPRTSCDPHVSHPRHNHINSSYESYQQKCVAELLFSFPLSPSGSIIDHVHDNMLYSDIYEVTSSNHDIDIDRININSSDDDNAHGYLWNIYPTVSLILLKNVFLISGSGSPFTYQITTSSAPPSSSDGDGHVVNISCYVFLSQPSYFTPLHSILSSDIEVLVYDIYSNIEKTYSTSSNIYPHQTLTYNIMSSLTSPSSAEEVFPYAVISISGLQMSCSNYYHWMIQCLPRLLVSFDAIVNISSLNEPKEINPNQTHYSNKKFDVLVQVLVPCVEIQYKGGKGYNTSSISFVKDTLDILNIKNNTFVSLHQHRLCLLKEYFSSLRKICSTVDRDQTYIGKIEVLEVPPYRVDHFNNVLTSDWNYNEAADEKIENLNYQETNNCVEENDNITYTSACSYSFGKLDHCNFTHSASEALKYRNKCTSRRKGMQFAIPRSVVAYIRDRVLHHSNNKYECKRSLGNLSKPLLVWISRSALYASTSSTKAGPNKELSRHIINEDFIIEKLLTNKNYNLNIDTNNSNKNNNGIYVITFTSDGYCKVNSKHLPVDTEILSICQCLNRKYKDNQVQLAIELFSMANIIIGAHGAGLANIIFSSPSAAIIEIALETPRHRDYMHLTAAQGNSYYILRSSLAVASHTFNYTDYTTEFYNDQIDNNGFDSVTDTLTVLPLRFDTNVNISYKVILRIVKVALSQLL